MTINEGTVDFDFPAAGKPCQTWYKIVGDLECGITPLITVHGGPGLTHHYMLPMVDFQEKFKIPVIFYDQLGNGLSTHLPEKLGDESFWNESLFHAELLNLISKLNIKTYDLIGQSWGGMMCSTFASKRPKGLRKLVLSNSPARDQDFVGSYNNYRKEMPQEVQDTLQRHEDAGTTKSKEYEEMMMLFYEKHMMRIVPFPKDFQTSFEWSEKDMTVVLTMLGPSEWAVTGSLRGWTAVPMIKNIAVPTLVINGVNEGASDEAIKPFVEMIPVVKWVKLKDSTHCPHWEERDNYIQIVGDWLMSK